MKKRKRLEKKVAKAVEYTDKIRTESFGGYPSEYVISHGKVYQAECVDGTPEATLIVTPIKKLLADYKELKKEF